MSTVAIIGAGPLGRWLALSAARAGFRVLLEDVMPANLHHAQEYLRQQLSPHRIAETLPALKGHGFSRAVGAPAEDAAFQAAEKLAPEGGGGFNPRIKPTESTPALATEGGSSEALPVTFVSTIEDAVREADLAIDCVPDELESKLEILWLLDRMAPPRTVLATPTTRLSIADLANCTYRPAQCIAIAAEASSLAGNPAAQILLRTTSKTSPETVALLDRFWRQLGFTPTFEPDPAEQQSS